MKARKSYRGRLRFCYFFMVMMVMLVVGTKQRSSCCCCCCRSWSYCCCCCCCRCCLWSSQADIRAEGEGNKGKGGSGKEKEEGEAQDEDGQQWWYPPGASHGWMDDANVGERGGWLEEGGGRTEEAKQGGQEGWRRSDWMPACDTCGMMWMMQMRQR